VYSILPLTSVPKKNLLIPKDCCEKSHAKKCQSDDQRENELCQQKVYHFH